MSTPLVWLPFDPADLGDPPEGLRYEQVVPGDLDRVPASVAEVELYVPPYGFTQADNDVIGQMTSLRVVQTMTAGVEHVRPHVPDGALLCNGRGIHDASTAELAMALMLASLRGIPGYVRAQDAGEWAHGTRPALADSTVLILGYGAVGAALERRLEGFEVDVLRVARTAREGVHGFDDLPALLPDADVVVLIVPLTDETRGLVDPDFLAQLKDGALLVNVARGPVVDTDALVVELASGRISAALDVTDPEPLPEDHVLWRLDGVFITPHNSGDTPEAEVAAHALARAQMLRHRAGLPLHHVVSGPARPSR